MAFIIGPSPGTNYSINANQTVRFVWGWPGFPAGRGGVLFFAMPPSIRTHGNRLVSFNHGIEQHGPHVVYTVDIRCENITGTGTGAGFQVLGGTLA
jgi:hypothetical protein